MKTVHLFKFATVALAMLTTLNSCEDPDPVKKTAPDPVADFSTKVDGRVATFENGSTDANAYVWDFGDGKTDTAANPVHEYEKYGKYTVTLIAKGEDNKADTFANEILLSKSSVIKLNDNSHADWSKIDYAFVSVDGNGGTLNKVKVDYDADNIYFYLESNAPADSVFGLQFDLDNDSTTGYKGWANKGVGGDIYMEGPLPWAEGTAWGFSTWIDGSAQNDWAWAPIEGATNYVFGGYSELSGNVVKVEFSVPKAKLVKGKLTVSDKVGIQLHQYINWGPAGFFNYTLDMTK